MVPRQGWAAFRDVTPTQLPPVTAATYRLLSGDVNGDGAVDAVVVSAGQPRLLLNDGHGHFTEATATHLPVLSLTPMAAILADVNGDGALDLVFANATGQNRLLRNDGQGHFTDVTASHLPTQTAVSVGLALGDVDGDGAPDLVVANRSGPVWLWRNDGQGHFTDATSGRLPATQERPTAVALADVDGNGTLDLLVVHQDTPARLWRNNGLGVFTEATASHFPAVVGPALDARFVDVDGDGALDLLLAAGADGAQLWRNDGQGHFTETTDTDLPTLPVFGITLATGDVDEDGTVDVILATAQGLTVLLNDGTGRFRNATPSWLPAGTDRVFGMALADVDGDLDLDLLVGIPQGPVRLLRNDLAAPRVRVAVAPPYRETGQPVTLTLTAFDEDGLAAATLQLTDPLGHTQVLPLPTLASTGQASTTFTPTLAGTYQALVTVTDTTGQRTTRQVAIPVQAADTTAPQVTLTVENVVPLVVGQTLRVRVTATDDRRVIHTTLTINGVSVPLATDGTASWPLTTAGLLPVAAQAVDAAGHVGVATTTLAISPDTTAPQVHVTVAPATVALAQPVTVTVTATDEVAVQTTALQVRGPALPTGLPLPLDAQGQARYTPFQPGTYTLTATARDPAGNLGTATTTFEAQGVVDAIPPVVQLSGVPTRTAVGRPLTLTLITTDNVGVTSRSLLINDTPQPLDAAGRVTYTPSVVGPYTVLATAQDAAGNVGQAQAVFEAIDASQDTEAPVVAILTPAQDATITVPTAIRGTVQDATLVSWTLAVSPRDEGRWTTLATGTTPVTDGALGTFDPTLLVNDLYELRLSAVDANARTSAVTTVVRVTGGMKVGHLSFVIEDLTIPVVGLPITIARVYDSRDTSRGDFGAGWRLDVQSIKVRKNRVLGTGWQQGKPNTLTYCVEPVGAHYVTLTMPDGRVEAFDLSLSPHCQTLFPIQEATLAFTPQAGTFGQLEAITDHTVLVVGALSPGIGVFSPVELLHFDTGDELGHYDPVGYRLTTVEGLLLDLDQRFEVQRVTEPNGNTVTFGPGGITHSAGPSVVFTRDAQGRITQITDPLGYTLQYTYDTAGDLVAVTDQEGHTTRYTYDATHRLTAIIDPRGVTTVRNVYDDTGRLIAHIDAEGHRIDYAHDLPGRAEVLTDQLGHITTHLYDDMGNIVQTTDHLGQRTTFTYDARSNLLSRTDPLGQTTRWTYDHRDNVLTQTDPLAQTTTTTYNTRNQVLTVTDPRGAVTTHTYDPAGNLLTTTDPLGHRTTHTYNARGQRITTTDATGAMWQYSYVASGHLAMARDPLGRETRYTYDANGNRLTLTTMRPAPDGALIPTVTTTVYDQRNRPVAHRDALGGQTTLTYDAAGRLVVLTDKNGHAVQHEYNARGQRIRTRYADGTEERTVYDAGGNRLRQIDRAGRTTHYTYDGLHRLVQTTLPDGSTTRTVYDAGGRVSARIDANGHQTRFGYDAAGRRTQQIDALGHTTIWAYDAQGNRTSVMDAAGQTTVYEYDARRRHLRTRFADGTVRTRQYDALDRLIGASDEAGQTTHWTYDATGRLTQVQDALGGTTTFTYDAGGQQRTQTDALGQTTQWSYDLLGQVTSRTLPLGMTEMLTYDAQGNLLTRTDFNGQTIRWTYDSNDRMQTKDLPDGTTGTIHYTPLGQPATVTDTRGVTTYAYDSRGRVVAVTSPEGFQVTYAYDAVGNRTAVTAPSGTTRYTYDARDQLTTVQDPDGGITTYTYDPVGNLHQTVLPNGTTLIRTYNRRHRLTQMEHRTLDGSVLVQYGYTFDATGRRVGVEEQPGARVAYTYDLLGRLLQERRADPQTGVTTRAYTYDAVGNRLTQMLDGVLTTYRYDANHRLLQAGETTYTADANGNVVQARDASGTTVYVYDPEDRLRTVTTPQRSAQYRYDAHGLLVSAVRDGVPTRYVVDTQLLSPQVLEEHDGAGAVVASYVYGLDRLRQARQGRLAYYHPDGSGSTRFLTAPSAAITDTYTYEAFGTLIATTGTTPNPYLFTGEAYDPVAGAYYLRARYYPPTLGRFLARDPFPGQSPEPVSLHPYLYAQADPVNFADPSGAVTQAAEGLAVATMQTRLGAVLAVLYQTRVYQRKAGVIAFLEHMAARVRGGAGEGNDDKQYLPIFRPGNDMQETTAHNRDAINEGKPYILHFKRPGHERAWRDTYARECSQRQRRHIAQQRGVEPAMLTCDEYPFAATEQGGLDNFLNGASVREVGAGRGVRGVSLRLVPGEEGPVQDQKFRAFTAECNIVPNTQSEASMFGVAPKLEQQNQPTDHTCGRRQHGL